MNKCALCGKKIDNTEEKFGLNCLKRLCYSLDIKDIKNYKDEKKLNKKIQKVCNKEGLSREQANLLTNRYLTLKLLNEVNLDEYDRYRKAVQKDIEISDVYDFTDFKELKEYINSKFPQNFIGSSANNFAMISVSSKVVHEYKIVIKFQMKKIILPNAKDQSVLI